MMSYHQTLQTEDYARTNRALKGFMPKLFEASPHKADDGTRTHDIQLGKRMFSVVFSKGFKLYFYTSFDFIVHLFDVLSA